MADYDILKRHKIYYFATKGLTKKDLIEIASILAQYEIDAVYKVNDYETNDINSVIKICEEKKISSLYVHSHPNEDAYHVSLHIIGEFSSWEVSFPPKGGVKERAVASQLFGDIKSILDTRREAFPKIPWSTLQNVLVFFPIFLLSVKVVFPTFIYDYLDMLRITIFAAVFNYSLELIKDRRILRRVIIVKPTLWERLSAARGWIGATIAAAAISIAFENALLYFYKLLN